MEVGAEEGVRQPIVRGVEFRITSGARSWEGLIIDDPSAVPTMFTIPAKFQPRLVFEAGSCTLFLPRGHGHARVSLDLVGETAADPVHVRDDGWTFFLEHLKTISIIMGGIVWEFLTVRS